jgi:hypothetical protein
LPEKQSAEIQSSGQEEKAFTDRQKTKQKNNPAILKNFLRFIMSMSPRSLQKLRLNQSYKSNVNPLAEAWPGEKPCDEVSGTKAQAWLYII